MKQLKHILSAILIAALVITGTIQTVYAQSTGISVETNELYNKLKAIPKVTKVTPMVILGDLFTEKFEVWFEQKTDPKNANSPTFQQRVILGHASYDAPVVVELEGYAIHSDREGELTKLFKANQLAIEHRYFDQSVPTSGIDWSTLTVQNAAYDQHLIIEAIKKAIYPGNKFISTGISKGGQTTMLHRMYYPTDVDASVCYVAPLNFEREDPRIYQFLKSVGTEKQRKQIEEFQLLCLKKKDKLVPLLKKWAKKNDWKWDFGVETAFEYYVLEYSFAFWQWGGIHFDELPTESSTDEVILEHLLNVSGVSFFENSGTDNLRPYFWAALTQEGIYGYEVEPFKDYLSQKSTYLFDFAFPKEEFAPFDGSQMKAVNDFIQDEATTMLFIYGELDTWSATAVELSAKAQSRGLQKYVLDNGHHGTRIKHFPQRQKMEIVETIANWIGVEEPDVD